MAVPIYHEDDVAFEDHKAAERALQEELGLLFPDHTTQRAWLDARNASLDGRTPRKAMENGESARVLNLVRSILYIGVS